MLPFCQKFAEYLSKERVLREGRERARASVISKNYVKRCLHEHLINLCTHASHTPVQMSTVINKLHEEKHVLVFNQGVSKALQCEPKTVFLKQ